MEQALKIILYILALLMLDLYALNGIRGISKKWRFLNQKGFTVIYWVCSVCAIGAIFFATYSNVDFGYRFPLVMAFFLALLFKVCFALVLLIDDIRRFVVSRKKRVEKAPIENQEVQDSHPAIPRSEFLVKAGLLAGMVPLTAMKLNMKSALYDYHVKRHKLYLPNLPKAFDGLKLGQISDIHSGSFYNKKAVAGGVDMLMREKPDLIFFTGDLINRFSGEMKHYQDIFSKVKAPLGVYSTLGNHDYGDYDYWSDPDQKAKNFQDLMATHKNMGWDLLMNENRRLKIGNEEIGILGVENWSEYSWTPKRGRLDLAAKNTDDLPVKLLLSHDPTHWREVVLPKYPQIDMVFAGHTHGMQLGVQWEHFQWSPIEYIYKEWAGFYRQGQQQIYVNVGYGFLEIPGRIGILPEITIFELKAGSDPSLNIG